MAVLPPLPVLRERAGARVISSCDNHSTNPITPTLSRSTGRGGRIRLAVRRESFRPIRLYLLAEAHFAHQAQRGGGCGSCVADSESAAIALARGAHCLAGDACLRRDFGRPSATRSDH